MKTNIVIYLILITSFNLNAHSIKGTLVLKGSLKTKIALGGKDVTCKVKIDKVKNLLEEDSFGNPAYKVQTLLSLEGTKFKKVLWLNNLFKISETRTIVQDLEYHSSDDSVKMMINEDGRIKTILIRFDGQTVNCDFTQLPRNV